MPAQYPHTVIIPIAIEYACRQTGLIEVLPLKLARTYIIALLISLCTCPLVTSAAETPEVQPIHWAYASFLGTGWYDVDGNRQVFVLRVPPRWYFRDSSIDDSGQRQLGIEFHFPVTFGLHKLDDIGDFIDFNNIGTVSFNPGVEIEYPVTKRWYLRAYGHLGWGTEIDSSENALIYDAGVKSRYTFERGKLDWAVVNTIFFAGFNTDDRKAESLGGMLASLDFAYPINLGSKSGKALRLEWDISYRWYQNKLSFQRPIPPPDKVINEWEIGLAIARRDGPIKIWFLNFQHLGLSYRFNSNGSYRAITVNFRSPFTR